MKTNNFILAFILAISFSANILAFDVSDAEYRVLPPYCKARMASGGMGSPEYKKWENIMGSKNFIHMHHYCSALNAVNRSYKVTNIEKRQQLLKRSLNGFTYIQENAKNDFFLQPEVCTKKGKVLVSLGRYGEALKEYNTAILLKQKYTPAYAALFDLYLKLEDKENAKKIIEEGLKHSPTSKRLIRRKRKLGK